MAARSVLVGIAAEDEAGAAAATRRFLALHTRSDLGVRRLAGRGALAFNELVASPADVYVHLEAGVLVAPRWLDHLLRALARPGCGLAGPSTNRAWNEQAATPAAAGTLAGVRGEAARLLARYGAGTRSLAPLHSLGAFCYAVRRDVVDAVGPADEAYGEGPCWEVDYNVRAARAGFAGVWVGASYAFRPPLAAPAADREELLLERNRRLFQDRFCGLRLAGATTGYRDHCEGDACEHFVLRLAPSDPGAPARATPRAPLVSCLMVTRERPRFAEQAVRCFLRQDYPNLELVVVEDGRPALQGRLPADPRIRVVPTGQQRTIGAMRNQSCELARGEVLVLWDDDDWHAPDRVGRQVEPILAGRASMTGLTDLTWLELGSMAAWRLDPRLQRRLLLDRVYAGTIAFRRDVWHRVARFPSRSLAEDAAFMRAAVQRRVPFEHVDGSELYVYVRHAGNSWYVEPGRSVDPGGWRRVPLPRVPPQDLELLRDAVRPPAGDLVSCIMPTRDRRRYVEQAIGYFLRQTYGSTELVVLDDGQDPVEDLVPRTGPVAYHRLPPGARLGTKRNAAVELARGDLIAHWDDDDWYSPVRIERQVATMAGTGAELVGASWLDFYDPERRLAWRYAWPGHRRPWLAGTSLLYRRELWSRNRFADVASSEDTRFVWRTPPRAVATTAEPDVVAIVHPGNTVPKAGRGAYWRSVPVDDVEAGLGRDLPFYTAMRLVPVGAER